jgi:hypothetical protein
MKWIEEKQALYRRNQELVEKVHPSPMRESDQTPLCSWGARWPLGLGTGSEPLYGSFWGSL